MRRAGRRAKKYKTWCVLRVQLDFWGGSNSFVVFFGSFIASF